jgi:hypothetical protein
VSAIDRTLVGDYDEQRRRVRLRAATTNTRKALWIDLHPALADVTEAMLGPREDRNLGGPPVRRLGSRRAADFDRKGVQGGGSPAVQPARPAPPADLAPSPARRTLGAGEFVGQRNLAVTANTYTHVLADETELDYVALLGRGA